MDKLEEVRSYVASRIKELEEVMDKLDDRWLSYTQGYESLVCRLDELKAVWDIIK